MKRGSQLHRVLMKPVKRDMSLYGWCSMQKAFSLQDTQAGTRHNYSLNLHQNPIMSKKASPPSTNGKPETCAVTVKITEDLKQSVIELLRSSQIPPDYFESIVCSPYVNLEVFITKKQSGADETDPGTEAPAFSQDQNLLRPAQVQSLFASATASVNDEDESILFKGAIKDPPSDPEHLLP